MILIFSNLGDSMILSSQAFWIVFSPSAGSADTQQLPYKRGPVSLSLSSALHHLNIYILALMGWPWPICRWWKADTVLQMRCPGWACVAGHRSSRCWHCQAVLHDGKPGWAGLQWLR